MTNGSVRIQALNLREQGKSFREIAKRLKVSVSTVHGWLKTPEVEQELEAREEKKAESLKQEVIQKGAKIIIHDLLSQLDFSMTKVDKQLHLASVMYIRACKSNNHRRMIDAMNLYMRLESLKISAITKVYDIMSRETQHPTADVKGKTLIIRRPDEGQNEIYNVPDTNRTN